MTTEKNISRFKTKLVIQPNGCWEYSGAKDADGYGMFWYDGKTRGAHQFSARYLGNFVVNKGQQICHSCDNPPCCNPAHLFIGTTQQNTADRHFKGRSVKGSRVGTSVYNESIIKAVKNAYKTRTHYRGIIKDISREFNVSYGVVWYACKRNAWPHIS